MTEQPNAEQIARFLEERTDIELTDWQRQALEWLAAGGTSLHYDRTQARREIERYLDLVAAWQAAYRRIDSEPLTFTVTVDTSRFDAAIERTHHLTDELAARFESEAGSLDRPPEDLEIDQNTEWRP